MECLSGRPWKVSDRAPECLGRKVCGASEDRTEDFKASGTVRIVELVAVSKNEDVWNLTQTGGS